MTFVDLRDCNEGMTCEEYSTLMIAGNAIPPEMRRRMNDHVRACDYHRSTAFTQSALSTPVTPEIEAYVFEP